MKKKRKLKWILASLTLIFAMGTVMGCTSGDKQVKKVNTKEEKSDKKQEETEKVKFKVGETAEYNDIQVTLKKIIKSKGDGQFIKPDKGKQFVLCNFEISNNSSSDISISSIVSFKAYCDDIVLNYDLLGMQSPEAKGLNQLDGEIEPGKKMKGVISYEVPKKWKKIEVTVNPSFWESENIRFIVKNK